MKIAFAFSWLMALPAVADQIAARDLLALPLADVVILGETHDNVTHHENQALAVAALRPAALVFEMLTAEQAKLTGDALAQAWAESWGDFALYQPILQAAPAARIYGANLPRAALKGAVDQGAAAMFGADAARYGLDSALPPAEQSAREAEQAQAHCNALPPDLLAGMVQAQRLRDAALARAVVQAMAETGGPVGVITGTGHARRDQGVPAVLALAAPDLRVLSVGQLESDPGPDAPFDLWIVTPPQPREDPCAGFASTD